MGVSPGQQTRGIVLGVSTEQRVPATLALHGHHHTLTLHWAEQSLHGLHCKPVCRAKSGSDWQHCTGHKGMGRTGGLAPVGLAGKAMFLPARSPEVNNFLWCHQLCGDDNMEEQSHKQAGGIKDHCLVALRHLDNHPQHHSCLQKKQPETALSAEASMGQGTRRDAGGAAL